MEQVLKEKKAGLSFFEKYLAGWIVLCMAAGIAISKIMPGVATAINAAQIGGISVPIGICLFMMMYPAVLNLQLDELKKLTRNPKPILLTLVANWIFAPIIGLVMANLFLDGHPELKVAIILLSASPCTAMVLVWGAMAEGNQEQNVVNTGINTITIMFFVRSAGRIDDRFAGYPHRQDGTRHFRTCIYRPADCAGIDFPQIHHGGEGTAMVCGGLQTFCWQTCYCGFADYPGGVVCIKRKYAFAESGISAAGICAIAAGLCNYSGD